MSLASPAPHDSSSIRSFVAVALPREVQDEISECARRMAVDLPDVRWSRKVENLHITLKFLGQVSPAWLERLATALELAAARIPAFEARVDGFGGFPSLARATVLWARVEGVESLQPSRAAEAGDDGGPGEDSFTRLADVVEQAATELGLGRDPDRRFRAHVTVGRCKRAVEAHRALRMVEGCRVRGFRVEELSLYESQLGGADGSTYLLRGRAPLGVATARV